MSPAVNEIQNASANRKQLRFNVVFCSGEDPEFPASELNTHSPQTKGWQSAALAEFPQEIGIQFQDGTIQMSQLQILSHEFKIATKIDVYVGAGENYNTATFKRLGYLSLDNNKRSNFAARELKSVYISCTGEFLKLRIYKCHLNQHNMFNQTGIIAINVLGQALNQGTTQSAPSVAPQYTAQLSKPAPMDDLAFDMNIDPTTARLIREVSLAKESAVRQEEYEQAKRLKSIENQLKAVGVQVAKLESQKQAAVREEDYDTAQIIKHEISRLRSGIDAEAMDAINATRQMQANGYGYGGANQLQHNMNRHKQVHHPEDVVIPRREMNRMNMHDGENTGNHSMPSPAIAPTSPHQPRFPVINNGTQLPNKPNIPMVSNDDNRPLPALANSASSLHENPKQSARSNRDNQNQDIQNHSPLVSGDPTKAHFEPESEKKTPRREDIIANGGVDPLEGVPGVEDLADPDEIPASTMNDAQPMIRVLGDYVVRCLYSRQVKLRTAALQKAEIELQKGEINVHEATTLSAMFSMVRIAITDKIAQVYVSGLRLLTASLDHLREMDAKNGETPRKSQVHAGLDTILPAIVNKLGDSNGRVREGSHDVLLQLAHFETVGPNFVATAIIRKQKKSSKNSNLWKPVLERILVVTEIAKDFGVSENPHSPLSLDMIMQLIADSSGHTHPHSEIRDASRDLTMVVYRSAIEANRDPVAAMDSYLADLRPKQMEEYQTGFNQIETQLGFVRKSGATMQVATTPKHQNVTPRGGRNSSRKPKASPSKASAYGSPKKTRNEAMSPKSKTNSTEVQENAPRNDNTNNNTQVGDTNLNADAHYDEEQYSDFADDEPFTCQFCFRYDPNFTEENLDVHYWRECPVLTSCPQCEQVIEVSMLNEHLLTECDKKDNHKRCPRCGEAIASQFFSQHCQRNTCRVAKPPEQANRCPLCHKDIPPGEEGWRQHLLGDPGCPKNPRTQ